MTCHLEEVGLAGDVVGAEAGVLAEVGEEAGLAGIPMHNPGMVCLMIILTWDMDLVTHTMVTAQRSLMATAPGKGAQALKC